MFTSWKDTHHQLFEAMKLEKIGTFITLLLIILVACFNLISCLLLIIVQKTKQFAILKVLGASDKTLENLILKQSLLIGGLSSLLGLSFGLLAVFVQTRFEIIKLPSDIYFVDVLPMEININDIFLINLVIFLMIMIAAKISSSKIRKTDFLEVDMTGNSLIIAKNIYKSYINGNNILPVLEKISFDIKEKDFVTVVGPSGIGKSTLLNIIGTLDKPDSGSIEFDGLDLSKMNDTQLSDLRLNMIGFVFQFHHLIPEFNVIDNVIMPNLIAEKKTQLFNGKGPT